MSLESLWAELESEQEWREAELRFLRNQMESLQREEERFRFRRALVVMLYSHFEGFCKFAFSLYIRAINEAGIECRHASYTIAAAALSDLFEALRDPARKCPEFQNQAPADERLHKFARDREFLERVREVDFRIVHIPEALVDLEANLKPMVLRKLLYRLGFPHDQFKDIEGNIHALLNYRNGIAHGSFKEGIPGDKYEALQSSVLMILGSIKRDIMAAIEGRRYLRSAG